MHGAKFVDFELPVLHAGAPLHMKKGARRLKTLADEDNQSHCWKNHQHHRNGDNEIDGPLQKSVKRIFQRFLAQSDESKSAIFEMCHRMAKFFLQVAQNQQTNPELIAYLDDVLVGVRK